MLIAAWWRGGTGSSAAVRSPRYLRWRFAGTRIGTSMYTCLRDTRSRGSHCTRRTGKSARKYARTCAGSSARVAIDCRSEYVPARISGHTHATTRHSGSRTNRNRGTGASRYRRGLLYLPFPFSRPPLQVLSERKCWCTGCYPPCK